MSSAALWLGLAWCSCAVARDGPLLNGTYLTPLNISSMHLTTWAVDFGSVADEPLMTPKNAWDEEIGGKGTILVDPTDGLYKAWYVSRESFR